MQMATFKVTEGGEGRKTENVILLLIQHSSIGHPHAGLFFFDRIPFFRPFKKVLKIVWSNVSMEQIGGSKDFHGDQN